MATEMWHREPGCAYPPLWLPCITSNFCGYCVHGCTLCALTSWSFPRMARSASILDCRRSITCSSRPTEATPRAAPGVPPPSAGFPLFSCACPGPWPCNCACAWPALGVPAPLPLPTAEALKSQVPRATADETPIGEDKTTSPVGERLHWAEPEHEVRRGGGAPAANACLGCCARALSCRSNWTRPCAWAQCSSKC